MSGKKNGAGGEAAVIIIKICLIAVVSAVLIIIGLNGLKRGYCSVPGCPRESARRADYCYVHKCSNSKCKNRAIDGYFYCRECYNRAN